MLNKLSRESNTQYLQLEFTNTITRRHALNHLKQAINQSVYYTILSSASANKQQIYIFIYLICISTCVYMYVVMWVCNNTTIYIRVLIYIRVCIDVCALVAKNKPNLVAFMEE